MTNLQSLSDEVPATPLDRVECAVIDRTYTCLVISLRV